MHQPETQPRFSTWYPYRVYPYQRQSFTGDEPARVVIVGAGPIGMATALDLARFGVPSLIIESERQVSHGSRAICLTRRSMEILQMIGCHQPFMDKGLGWNLGRSFYRGKEVFQMQLPDSDENRFPPILNIQQQYIEQYLIEAIEANPLTRIQWGSSVTGIRQDQEVATLSIDTAEGDYDLAADWVIAADGGRSTIRKLMKLRMEGKAYSGNFVIADIQADIDLPTERRCYFDPEWNPGNNVLVHREPDGIWRLDFRLPDGETPEQALEKQVLTQRINSILQMIGQRVKWSLDWATVYSASTKTLPDFVHDRVLFVGDAAHLLPIFGVRGANTGFQDSNNLAWKLAAVIHGGSDKKLLYSYSSERVQAAREICDEGGKSTRFMTPPTAGYRRLRDAVLSLSLSQDFVKNLMHWRTSRPHTYANSSLNATDDGGEAFTAGPAIGEVAHSHRLADNDFLLDYLQGALTLLVFATEANGPVFEMQSSFPLRRIVVNRNGSPVPGADLVIRDRNDELSQAYGAEVGTVYLIRPDQHVCGRWKHVAAESLQAAINRAVCAEEF
ncbi:monooxygenase [Pseudomaricurvus alkylphenolicus]|uniref:FAD-dependent monooxygenase n=1 Tax=Pseudomaricurvus alkylphenolicus TaxID=1306991 RepID=UPI0014214017|nr:FAD-dependent monooxygenase [Pseudomaricurvus alkylphenolicus]NIB40792.1 monooxygenase [Pseudomaricurvus alkylphenolicus]